MGGREKGRGIGEREVRDAAPFPFPFRAFLPPTTPLPVLRLPPLIPTSDCYQISPRNINSYSGRSCEVRIRSPGINSHDILCKKKKKKMKGKLNGDKLCELK